MAKFAYAGTHSLCESDSIIGAAKPALLPFGNLKGAVLYDYFETTRLQPLRGFGFPFAESAQANHPAEQANHRERVGAS